MKRKIAYVFCCILGSSFAHAIHEDFALTVASLEKTNSLSYFVDASFIYWYAKEDGLEIAENSILNERGRNFLAPSAHVLEQSFSYNPGFKVGMGMQGETWSLQTEYTWLRSKTTTSKKAPKNNTSIAGIGVWNVDDWFLQTTALGQSPTGSHISSHWHLGLDMIDLLASNPLFLKRNSRVSSFIGLSTVWIRQKMNLALTQSAASVGLSFLPPQPIHSTNSSHSWGIGPKAGLDTQYHFPKGFRIEGMFSGSLLYTQFTSVKHQEDSIVNSSISTADSILTRMNSYSSVRPIMELGLGTGWGMDLAQNKYHLDFLVSYDFSIFWGQNVMRKMLDEFWSGTSASPGDLYFQGVTVTASFAF